MDFSGRKLSLETGRLAKQAHGAVLAQYGETVVLATVVSAYDARPNIDFLPLTVDYQERTFAAGKIPGGFFKREGRPSEKEILTSRLIDRSMRPLFPKGYDKETQIVVTVLSADRDNDPDMLSLIAASAALEVSDIPHAGPVAAVRMGRVDGKLVANPTAEQLEQSDISMVVAAKPDSIVMLEGGAQIVDEEPILEALFTAHEMLDPIFELQNELRRLAGKPKREFKPKVLDPAILEAARQRMAPELEAALAIAGKKERGAAVYALSDKTVAELVRALSRPRKGTRTRPAKKSSASACAGSSSSRTSGSMIANRPTSGRSARRSRCCRARMARRCSRAARLRPWRRSRSAPAQDEQKIDALMGERYKKFMLHYNFPPFSTGEVKFLRGPGRREIGHGALAERALLPVLPPEEDFPYTIRVVSEVLESNGSSSMATVCGGSLALMDAGVPITLGGRGNRDGPGQGRRAGPRAHRHPGRRGPSR